MSPEFEIDLVTIAEDIAREAHLGQTRRDGYTPYIVHPQAVAQRCYGDEAKVVAWLHDVLEDCLSPMRDAPEWSAEKLIRRGIPERLAKEVEVLTKKKCEKYTDYIERIVAHGGLAAYVKVEDILANLSDDPSKYQIKKYAAALLVLMDD